MYLTLYIYNYAFIDQSIENIINRKKKYEQKYSNFKFMKIKKKLIIIAMTNAISIWA